MRQMISGAAVAIAAMTAGAVPALACGFTPCSPCGQAYSPCEQVYTPPVVSTGCNTGCGGWAYERLAEPTTQYYYVNQGPTYTGPGSFAPYPTYQESAVSGAGVEGPAVTSYHWHHRFHYRPWHQSYRYGYAPYHRHVHYGYVPNYYGHHVQRRYY
jgi:hypothetical protein